MGEVHTFEVESIWTGDADGDGMLKGPDFHLDYNRPACLGGPGNQTNPEEMLVAAVVSCYSITLAGMAEGRRLPVTRIDVASEGDVVRGEDRRLKFTAIRLRPRIFTTSTDEVQQQKILDSAHRAEDYCLVSQAMRGIVEITVEPELVVEAEPALVAA